MFDSELQFSVELWSNDDVLEETIAKARNLLIGRGAFEAATKLYPARRTLMRHGARIVERHVPPPAAPPD
jgi:hypothetical protein